MCERWAQRTAVRQTRSDSDEDRRKERIETYRTVRRNPRNHDPVFLSLSSEENVGRLTRFQNLCHRYPMYDTPNKISLRKTKKKRSLKSHCGGRDRQKTVALLNTNKNRRLFHMIAPKDHTTNPLNRVNHTAAKKKWNYKIDCSFDWNHYKIAFFKTSGGEDIIRRLKIIRIKLHGRWFSYFEHRVMK